MNHYELGDDQPIHFHWEIRTLKTWSRWYSLDQVAVSLIRKTQGVEHKKPAGNYQSLEIFANLIPMKLLRFVTISHQSPHPLNNPIKHPMKSHWNHHFCWLKHVKPPNVHLVISSPTFATSFSDVFGTQVSLAGSVPAAARCVAGWTSWTWWGENGETKMGILGYFLSEKAWENGRTLGFSVANMDLWIWLQTWQT